jgi:type 1 fimbriae regulatory protein FimB/type 1 fimbriae regulatory protein FimE
LTDPTPLVYLSHERLIMGKYGSPHSERRREMGEVIDLRQPSKTGKSTPPPRRKNAEVRSREYLAPAEIEALIAAAKGSGRHSHRDATLILLAYRHALRVGEAVSLRRDQVDLEQGLLHVSRLKNGTPAVHPLRGPELRALRKLFREYPDSPYVFSTERKGPMTAATVRKIVARAGEVAELGFPAHPHMLRHATGYYLASKGHDTRSIQAYLGD